MGKKNALLAALFLFLIVADASWLPSTFRKLIDAAPKDQNSATIVPPSPTPSPVPGDNNSDPKPKGVKPNNPESPPNSTPSVTPLSQKNDDINEKDSKSGTNGNCDRSCDRNRLIACVKSIESGSKAVVLVRNVGENNLNVTLTLEKVTKRLEIPKHQNITVNFTLTSGKSSELTLDAGNGNCTLQMVGLPIEESLFVFPSYEKLVTPVNGAYFLIFTVVVFGGTWACCMFRKRRRHGGVPYQELEMGLPESVSAANVETADGWDQGWDDDWDEENAVKSPGGHRVGSISANGLTSRSSNKDGWENGWDD